MFNNKKKPSNNTNEQPITNNEQQPTNSVEKPNSNKKSKNTVAKKVKNKKMAHDKSELAKRLNIRISSPYGYYPEDVDPIIARLEKEVSDLEKENSKISKENNDLNQNLTQLKSEFTQFKLQVSTMGFDPMSDEDAAMNIDKLNQITGGQPASQVDIMTASAFLNDDSDIDFSLEAPVQEQPKEPPKQALKIKLKKS